MDSISRRYFVKIMSVSLGPAGLRLLSAHDLNSKDEVTPQSLIDTDEVPTPRIAIDPYRQRSIDGISDLKREVYFNLDDPGTDFDSRCRSEERYDFLVKQNAITFGGTVHVVAKAIDARAVKEDPTHPGFPDTTYLKERLAAQVQAPSEQFRRDTGGRLVIAAHESPYAFPTFIGDYTLKAAIRDKVKHRSLPANVAGAAQLAADTLRWAYTNFDRPAFYAPINEPSYVYWQDPHLAEWHLATQKAVHQSTSGVRVGGPCLPVAYFYRNQYGAFAGLKDFIDNTHCNLDYYSFHVYDYLKREGDHFSGRVTSGLPLESVLNLVENYTVNAYGKRVGIVVSEHGSLSGDGEQLAAGLAREGVPASEFQQELKKRSVEDFNMVSSAIANTLVFMDHPKTVLKAVPFILLNEFAWNPEAVDVLYVPRDFTNKSDWVPTQMIMFYRLFRDLKGHRVTAFCADPDIQTRAFADGNTLFVVLNNLCRQLKTVALDVPTPQSTTIRRFGRHDDLTPYLTEQSLGDVARLDLQPRETVLLKAEYSHTLGPRRAVNEICCYGAPTTARIPHNGKAHFVIRLPNQSPVSYATLLIGVSRPRDAGWDVRVTFNGQRVFVPLERCAERLVDKEYASCKVIQLDPATIKKANAIDVSFPDGRPGAVGAVVLRAGMPVVPQP